MKIAVVGFSGSGKSTLARRLGKIYGMTVLHLDSVHWLPGWAERPEAEERAMVEEFLNSHEEWVIDGNYSSLSYDRRMAEADRIVQMLFPPLPALGRVLRRRRQYSGANRPDLPEGCPEKVDGEFVRWVLWDGRSKDTRARYAKYRALYPDKTVVLRTQRQIDRFLGRTGAPD